MNREHTMYKCECRRVGCMFCDGGLGAGTVCGAFEGQLLTSCPGVPLTEEALEACYSGNVIDFAAVREAREYHTRAGIAWPSPWALRVMRRGPRACS